MSNPKNDNKVNYLTDFSEISEGTISDEIGVSTITHSNKAVRQNLGIYAVGKKKLRTGRYCGITWQRDNKGVVILNSEGEKQPLSIKPRFELDLDSMIQTIAEDEEFYEYLCDDQPEGERMFTFFFDEELMEVASDDLGKNRIIVAMSFIHLLYQETGRMIMKKIVREEENFTGKIKGKILFSKQVKKNWSQGHNERIYCSYVEKSEDIFENRILKYALTQAIEYLQSEKIQNNQVIYEARACMLRFLKVKELANIDPEKINEIRLPVMYSGYEPVMKMAYAVTAEIVMTTNLKNEATKIVPYAVNMPLLFECYCRALIKENIKNKKIRMLKFVKNKFGDYDEDEYGIKNISEKECYMSGKMVPDIVLCEKGTRNEKEKIYILDVKYKDICWIHDKKNNKVVLKSKKEYRREDRLQLLAYNEVFQPEFCGHIFPCFYVVPKTDSVIDSSWWHKKEIIPEKWYWMFSVMHDEKGKKVMGIKISEGIQENNKENDKKK